MNNKEGMIIVLNTKYSARKVASNIHFTPVNVRSSSSVGSSDRVLTLTLQLLCVICVWPHGPNGHRYATLP